MDIKLSNPNLSAEHLQNNDDIEALDIPENLYNSNVTCIKSDDFFKICKINASEYIEEKDLKMFNEFSEPGNFKYYFSSITKVQI